ncbi:MAG: hypothetical protein U9O89_01210 [Thermoproteota archaeon]|nr:hypothetical protein [Thermoproteota archaeon]
MSSSPEKKASTMSSETERPNAGLATAIALNFLKTLGNKGKFKPKRASLEDEHYMVEVELKRSTATVQIDAATGEIKEYAIEPKVGESSGFSFSPKTILLACGIAVALFFVLNVLGLQSLFGSLL